MMSHVINHTALPARHDIFNHAGLTPLELSYRLGRGELFAHLLDLSSETQWTYGNVANVAYPLTGLDSIGSGGELSKLKELHPFRCSPGFSGCIVNLGVILGHIRS